MLFKQNKSVFCSKHTVLFLVCVYVWVTLLCTLCVAAECQVQWSIWFCLCDGILVFRCLNFMCIFNGKLANHLPHQLLRSQWNNGVAALREFWVIYSSMVHQLTIPVNNEMSEAAFKLVFHALSCPANPPEGAQDQKS